MARVIRRLARALVVRVISDENEKHLADDKCRCSLAVVLSRPLDLLQIDRNSGE